MNATVAPAPRMALAVKVDARTTHHFRSSSLPVAAHPSRTLRCGPYAARTASTVLWAGPAGRMRAASVSAMPRTTCRARRARPATCLAAKPLPRVALRPSTNKPAGTTARCGVPCHAPLDCGPRPCIAGGIPCGTGRFGVGSVASPEACSKLKSHRNRPRSQAKRGVALPATSDSDISPSAGDPKCKAPKP